MNKRFVLPIFFVLILIFSITAIQAGDVNSTVASINANETLTIDSNLDALAEDFSNDKAKNSTELAPQSDNIYYYGDYNVSLKDSNTNNSLEGKQIRLVINDVNYTIVTGISGIAGLNLNLTPGKYSVSAYFDGDELFESSNFTSTFSILPTVTSKDITKYYKGGTKYTATFYDSLGNPLANRNFAISVNGKSYTAKTNSKGVVSLAVNLKPGTYKVIATDPITGYKMTTTFRILSTISSSNLNKVEGDGRKFTVKFFTSNGKALTKKYVKIKFKGKTKKYKTNAAGKVSLPVKKLKKGTYYVTCYNNGLTKTYKIKVFKKKASTKLTAWDYTYYTNQTKTIKVKLSTALNDYSNIGKVIKIKVNGKTYYKKTDSKGMVTFNLPALKKGLYKVQYTYDGTKYFKKASSTRLLTILDTRTTELNVKGITSFGYGAGSSLTVAYTAGGVPLAKKSVSITLNGITYTETTDNKGLVYLPIDLDIGKYEVSYEAEGDSKVDGTSGSSFIDVFKREPSKVTWKSPKTFKDAWQAFKILVRDSNGNPILGKSVKLTIDGESYYAKTDSKGYATVKTSVAIGHYKVSFKFLGSNDFAPSASSKTIKVKLSTYKNGINQKNTISYLKSYIKSSSHCKVGTKAIKKLVKSLTKGKKSKVDKARAIFNWVRDNLGYSYYYDTKYGATKTLKYMRGNCVDHSHLLVSMFRTAGLKARYVHGVCKFPYSGTTGHVWTQVLIGKNWVCADATSYRNSLGKIANWNTKSYHIHAKYASLPF